jgi:glycosyltransferase involved in cell wall biosynthesis
MKIAQVVCTLPPYGGGIGVVAHHYAEEMVKQGHDVTVFTTRHRVKTNFTHPYKVIWLWPWLRYGNAAALPQLLWRIRKYDVVHLHFPFFGAAFFVYLLKILRGKKMKLVVSYHMDVVGHGLFKNIFGFYNKHILETILRRADLVVAASFDYIEGANIADYFFEHRDKFVEIPFGVSDRYRPDRKNPSLLKKYKISDDDKIIGFVGTLDAAHYFKGVNILLMAISKIPNPRVKALIVGDGNLKGKYQKQAMALGIADRVIFSGYVTNDLLPEHYNLFDLSVLPSVDKSEAFGLVLLEAMACGKPLIASNLKGVRSVVIPGQNGLLIEPKNPQDLVDKITYILDNPKLKTQFSLNGINLVNTKYRWPIIANSLLQVYKNTK